MNLDSIRQEIDQIDDQIVKLLEERMHLVEGVVAYKKASGKPILDTCLLYTSDAADDSLPFQK